MFSHYLVFLQTLPVRNRWHSCACSYFSIICCRFFRCLFSVTKHLKYGYVTKCTRTLSLPCKDRWEREKVTAWRSSMPLSI
jgi:hypothetical protein